MINKNGLKPQRRNCKFICLPHEKVGAKNPNYSNNLKLLMEAQRNPDHTIFSGVKDCAYDLLDESKIDNEFNIEIKKYKVKI